MVWKECTSPSVKRPEITSIIAVDWIKVVKFNDRIVTLLRHELDHGEGEAIALALELLLLDDSDAREKARLYVVGLPLVMKYGMPLVLLNALNSVVARKRGMYGVQPRTI